jgi:hypothetical protein
LLHSKQSYILATALLALSSASVSKEISYDYIQGTYSSITIDTETSAGDLDGDALAVSGSFSVAPSIAITAGFGATSFDRLFGIDFDTTELTIGVTAHMAIAPNADIFGNFSVLRANIEVSDGFVTIDDDDTGNVISVGLRFLATEKIELELGFSRTDVFEETDNSFGAGIRFYANEKFSLGIGYSTADDVDSIVLNARFDIK